MEAIPGQEAATALVLACAWGTLDFSAWRLRLNQCNISD